MRVQQIAGALTLSVALAVIGLITATPASAAEDVTEVKTRLKIKRDKDSNRGFKVVGVVRSAEEACERHRLVRLRLSWPAARAPSVPGRHGARTRTNRRGVFKARFRGDPGYWFAGVDSRFLPPGEGGRLECEAAGSGLFRLPRSPRSSSWWDSPRPVRTRNRTAPASAAGEVREVKTRLTIRSRGSMGRERFVRGRVHSPERKCEGNRLVKVIAPKYGRRYRDRTGSSGGFLLEWIERNAREHYRIKVFRSFREDDSLRCKADEVRFRFNP
jgi:hypothetical protein